MMFVIINNNSNNSRATLIQKKKAKVGTNFSKIEQMFKNRFNLK